MSGRIRPESVRLKDAGNVVPIRDGLISMLTGMGTSTDQRSYSRYFARVMSDVEIDQAYRGSWVMRKAIDKPATEMVREWRDWQADSADIEKLEAEEKRLDIRNKVRRAECLRGLGGAGMVLYVGGSDAEQANAIDPTRIRAGDLKAIHVWHRSRFALGPMIDTWGDPWFGHPSYYEVQLSGTSGGKTMRFHPSRVVAFKGEPVTDIAGVDWRDAHWGQAKVQTIIDAIQNVDTADTGFAALISQARLRRIYIPKLLDMLSQPGGEAKLAKRLQAFALGESNNSVSWLDGGDGATGAEKIDDKQVTWTGMPDIMAAYRTAAAAAADMPATVLWGISPQGMNATGDSDITLFHKTIKGRQDLDLRPCMTQIDAVLVPSALGRVDDGLWYDWAPLSTQSEKDEATTFFTFMQGVEKLQATGAIPGVAFDKALQNTLEERSWFPGLGDALAEIPEDERFPSLSEPDPNEQDPNAIQAEGGDQTTGGKVAPLRRAANDTRFVDGADPKTLYIERKLLNADEVIRWAKSQGLETTLAPADMHVTVAYSRTPVDWFSVGTDWAGDQDGKLRVKPGGARTVERLGDGDAVALLFASDDLKWRHDRIAEAGASWDWPDYRPHITLSWNAPGVDVAAIKPYVGPLVFGPELFSTVNEDWKSGVTEE
jgi:phage-related protein (TIGR01555 family)